MLIKKNKIFDGPVLLIGLAVTLLVVAYSAYAGTAMLKRDAVHVAEVYSARSERLLSSLFHKTDVVEAVVLARGGQIDQLTFDNVAKSLFDGDGIKAVQYLPDGVVRYCYPLAGNEPVMGGSIFKNPKRRKDALLALNTREIALSGPYTLTQGGFGLVARNPIFFTDTAGQEKFLGFSVIILDLPSALNSIMLQELPSLGYNYRLYCMAEDGSELTISQSEVINAVRPVSCTIGVPNNTWTLDLFPVQGWLDWRELIQEALLGLLISFLLAVIFKQKAKQAQVLYQFAYTDELTGLFNRRWLSEQIEKRLKNTAELPFVIFYFDLDHFKQVNDCYGHYFGDGLLRDFAGRLRCIFGPDSALVRIGGDEFAVLLPLANDSPQQVAAYQQALDNDLAAAFVQDHAAVNYAVSMGWAQFPVDGDSYDSLLKVADQRMYQAKKRCCR